MNDQKEITDSSTEPRGGLVRREEGEKGPPAAPAFASSQQDSSLQPQDARAAAAEYGLGLFKGIIGAIPWVGNLLNEMMFEARSRLKQARLNQFFTQVAQDVNSLSEDKLDKDYLRTEEFSDFIEEVCLRVSRERSEEKRTYFRKVLLDAFKGGRQPDFSAAFLNILQEITVEEISVLSGYVWAYHRKAELQARGEKAEAQPVDYSQKEIAGLAPSDYRKVVQSLIRKGLLFDDSYGRWDATPYTFFQATDLGADFYKWLKD
jgi:hypothetical protein